VTANWASPIGTANSALRVGMARLTMVRSSRSMNSAKTVTIATLYLDGIAAFPMRIAPRSGVSRRDQVGFLLSRPSRHSGATFTRTG
jgi:hypothetical protein